MKLTNAQKEKYFKEGFETRREGYSEKANPYKGLSEGEHWLQGWNCRNRMISPQRYVLPRKHDDF